MTIVTGGAASFASSPGWIARATRRRPIVTIEASPCREPRGVSPHALPLRSREPATRAGRSLPYCSHNTTASLLVRPRWASRLSERVLLRGREHCRRSSFGFGREAPSSAHRSASDRRPGPTTIPRGRNHHTPLHTTNVLRAAPCCTFSLPKRRGSRTPNPLPRLTSRVRTLRPLHLSLRAVDGLMARAREAITG